MKKILSIYIQDMNRILHNWPALIIIAGLVVLPSLYAWFNIESSWDPYSNTKGIKVAVVSNDKGAEILGKSINAGEEIIETLRTNEKIGWVFTSEADALSGVKKGHYYASIIIPADFSAGLATVLTNTPTQPELEYYVNEKINAVAPKITSSGATSIVSEIGENFVKTANGVIFKGFNELGIKLEEELPSIEKLKSLIFRFEEMMPELTNAADVALTDVNDLKKMVKQAKEILPEIERVSTQASAFSSKLAEVLPKVQNAADAVLPLIKQNITLINQTASHVLTLTEALQNVDLSPEEITQKLDDLEPKLTLLLRLTEDAAGLLNAFQNYLPDQVYTSITSKFDQLYDRLNTQLNIIDSIRKVLEQGQDPSELLDKLHNTAEETVSISENLLRRYDIEIAPAIKTALDKAANTAQKANQALQSAVKALPRIKEIMQDAEKGLTVGGDALVKVKSELPTVQKKITAIADNIREFDRSGNLQEIIDLLRNDFQKESAFFASPVTLKEHKLYPIPNYGSAMSPFFTTLSLWVGALLLVSLLTVEIHEHNHVKEGENHSENNDDGPIAATYRPYQVYFGRYLTFMTLALLQSLVVTLGDLFLLKTYVHDPVYFVLFGLLISSVFMIIVYTLVSVFGNVGKAMAIVLLVLQLGGAGGTFPIEVTPPFFQFIHPFLPFTYGISLMREAAGGILGEVVTRDIIVLLIIAGLFMLLGLALKKPINKLSEPLVKKARESNIIH
ncbi:YhgE/Pip domain-containing protein [Paenibacillus sp. Marseille-Q4541]|uniref:YhgE/Pip domain-containing protein n=1 Tax=Paenibacillus sp. Marseille-Q4541 TaxID=2831522 RepID=UPI001BAB11FF|nr:YhgE/Pip domain-containing protein [Paenibacillus sp. Marseille-Q4541]